METIFFRPMFHKGAEYIGIHFERNISITDKIKTLRAARWSQSKGCWYIPFSKEELKKAYTSLKHLGQLNIDELRSYLQKRKTVEHTIWPKERPESRGEMR